MKQTKEDKLSLSHKLTEAWIVNEYEVSLNGCDIRDVDILDFECMFGGCEIRAKLMFEDTQGFMTGKVKGSPPLAIGGFVKVGWNAAGDCGGRYENIFSIEKVNSQIEHNKRLVVLDLIDTDTRSLKGTFETSFFEEKTFTEGVEEHIKKHVEIPNLVIVPHKKEASLNFAIPSNEDFHQWLKGSALEQGMKFIRDKFNAYLVSKDWTEFDKLQSTVEEFEVDAATEFSFWRILQYNLDGFDMAAVMDAMPTSLTNNPRSLINDTETKFTKTLAVDAKKSAQDGGAGSVKQSNNTHHRGSKQGIKTNQVMHQYFTSLSNAQQCSIWVPGINSNRVGKKVIVNFPRPSYLVQDEYDEIFSGYWEVTAVRDKIIRQYFVQELYLRRVGGK